MTFAPVGHAIGAVDALTGASGDSALSNFGRNARNLAGAGANEVWRGPLNLATGAHPNQLTRASEQQASEAPDAFGVQGSRMLRDTGNALGTTAAPMALTGGLGGPGALGRFTPAVAGRAAQGTVAQTPGVAAGVVNAAQRASMGVRSLVGRIPTTAKWVGGVAAGGAVANGATELGARALEGAPQWANRDVVDFSESPARQAAFATAHEMMAKGDNAPMQQFLASTLEQRAPYMAQQAGVDVGEYKGALAKMNPQQLLDESLKWNPDLKRQAQSLQAQGDANPIATISSGFGKLPQWAQMVLGMGLPLGLIAMAGASGAVPMLLAALGLGAGAHGLSQGGFGQQPQQPQSNPAGAADDPFADLDTAVAARLGDHNAFGDVVEKNTWIPRSLAHGVRNLAPDWTNQQIEQNAIAEIQRRSGGRFSPEQAQRIWGEQLTRGSAERAQAQADTQRLVQQSQ